ncbi:FAD-dependent oxidoreductase [Engelhardtia mirabilis]|uniref:Monomeric sarcosine oxidase n=1 Tax=Engelhardtia mirabilis TaxID=2528011 RepID=A0A518BPZ3_9BACT|nr:Monomeric sarcosine oxidase [Planctomycetes bacterium Pla133]QDV03372.1 Monomeric sarcosine oxidase [Planctomycetes bacterium Pla86]
MRSQRPSSHIAVVGAGAFGGWSALQLARAGHRVTLVDAWGPGNARSSSGGESRVLRRSYGASELFTRMAARSLDLWRGFEVERGRRLFHETGLLWMAGAVDDRTERDSLAGLRSIGVTPQVLDAAQVAERYPAISPEGIEWAFVEPGAGSLLARRSCAEVRDALLEARGSYLTARARLGPRDGGRLRHLEVEGHDRLEADAFVLAAGPWLGELVRRAGTHLRVTRQEVFYFGTPPGDEAHRGLPVWSDHAERFWYGIPETEARGFKLADDTRGEVCDPSTQDRSPSAAGLERAREHLALRFPGLRAAPLLEARVCQYTETPDGAFVVDRHPDLDNVWIAGGGSGHGFKHGPALGEHVAQLVSGAREVEPRFALARFD